MNTKIVRLSSGEEIICGLEKKKDSYIIKKPAILVPVGKGNIGLMPWLPYANFSDNTIEIADRFVMFTIDAQSDLMNEYNTAFGSGLLVPNAGGVLPQGANDIPSENNPALKLTT
tara:strand:+ start:409 stop:753 length:345 start_codon:yes stop_codon:yes gene_type:complete